jgi:hypothetical protein
VTITDPVATPGAVFVHVAAPVAAPQLRVVVSVHVYSGQDTWLELLDELLLDLLLLDELEELLIDDELDELELEELDELLLEELELDELLLEELELDELLLEELELDELLLEELDELLLEEELDELLLEELDELLFELELDELLLEELDELLFELELDELLLEELDELLFELELDELLLLELLELELLELLDEQSMPAHRVPGPQPSKALQTLHSFSPGDSLAPTVKDMGTSTNGVKHSGSFGGGTQVGQPPRIGQVQPLPIAMPPPTGTHEVSTAFAPPPWK